MSAALDLGSSEFRSLRRVDDRLIARRLPAVYTMVDDTPANRRVLEQSRHTYSATEGTLVVIGDAALDVSSLLSRPLIPLLPGGQLEDQDPIGRQVCVWLIELLLPQATHPSQQCLISLPRGEVESEGATGWTSKFLEHVVQLQGYQTEIISPVTALALGELEESEFTGICLDIGAEAITLGVMRQSQPVFTARFLKGSREVIERFGHVRKKYVWDHSGNAYIDLPSIQSWLTHGDISLVSPSSPDEEWLAEAYSELLLSALFSMKRKLRTALDSEFERPLPMVLSGGPVRLTGFSQLVQEAIDLSQLPVPISGIRTATFEPYSIARGLLIQATLNAGEEVQPGLSVEAA